MRRLVALPLALLLYACPPTVDPGECPSGSETQQAAGKLVVQQRCATCHGTMVMGGARAGAPEDLNFDNLETVRAEADAMYGQSSEGQMPPGSPLSIQELADMRVWLACGAPE